MSLAQSLRINRIVEYIRHQAEFNCEGFQWNVEDIEDDILAVLASYGIVENFSDEEIARLKNELEILADEEQTREMERIYAVEA
jgi:hypothetical protein